MLIDDAAPHVLLVEGADDEHVVRHLWGRKNSSSDFEIIDKRGVDPLLDSIRVEVRAPGRRAIGIIVDADDHPEDRWNAISDRLRRAHVTPPSAPAPAGTIIDGRPRIGVWLMPNNQARGELEDFVARMIPEKDAVWPLAQAYVDGIPASERKFASGKMLRAKVHSWLATREFPRKMGMAIGAGDLSVSATDAARLVAWLQRLFR